MKEKIIKTAINLYMTKGLTFTMQDIANVMHISKKTIYVYYSSKEDLLMAMVDDTFSKIHKRKHEILDADISTLEKLEKVIIASPEQYQAMDLNKLEELQKQYPRVSGRVKYHLNTGWEPTIKLLKQASDEKIIKDISIPVIKTMISYSIEGFLSDKDILEETGLSYQEILEEMISIILEGIRI